MNPGRCREEAEFRDAAATGSVKTHFANTLAFLFGVQYNFEPSKEEAYLVDSIYHSHAAAEMCKKVPLGGSSCLEVQGDFAIGWKCTRMCGNKTLL